MVAGEDAPSRERLALKVFAEHGADAVAIVSSAISPREGRERLDPARLVLLQPDHRSLPRRDGPVTPGVILTDDSPPAAQSVLSIGDVTVVEGAGASNALREAASRRPSRPRVQPRAGRSTPRRRLAAALAAGSQRTTKALVCYDDKPRWPSWTRSALDRIPADVAMVGFDGIRSPISNPRLTTVVAAEMAGWPPPLVHAIGRDCAGGHLRPELVGEHARHRLNGDAPGIDPRSAGPATRRPGASPGSVEEGDHPLPIRRGATAAAGDPGLGAEDHLFHDRRAAADGTKGRSVT
jgi:hypothetical protein